MAGGKKQNKNDKRKKDRSEERGKAEERVGKSAATVVVETPTPEPAPVAEPAVVLEAEPPVARGRLTAMVPVRFDAQMLDAVRSRAAEDQRSVSSWIRRAVDHELQRGH